MAYWSEHLNGFHKAPVQIPLRKNIYMHSFSNSYIIIYYTFPPFQNKLSVLNLAVFLPNIVSMSLLNVDVKGVALFFVYAA